MAPTKAEKEREEQRQRTLEKGRFAATESNDNAVAASNENFVGVSPEYKEFASTTDEPLEGEYERDDDPEKVAFEKTRERDAALAETNRKVGFRGYSPDTPHPSQARNPADPYINQNREALANQASPASTVETTSAEVPPEESNNAPDGGDGSSTGGDQG